jgi:queuosine precursor transporter
MDWENVKVKVARREDDRDRRGAKGGERYGSAAITDTPKRTYKYYDLLVGAFVCVLLCANLIGVSKVTQVTLPIVGTFVFGAGNLFFPLSYLLDDILTEVYGYAHARRALWAGFGALGFASLMSFVIVHLPPAEGWTGQETIEAAFGSTWRIAGASLAAYFWGEFANTFTLAKLKVLTNKRLLWMRLYGSTIVGQAVDTLIFYPLAFLGTWETSLLISVMLANYCIKVGYEVVASPLTYRVVNLLKQKEQQDYLDRNTDFTPFKLKI